MRRSGFVHACGYSSIASISASIHSRCLRVFAMAIRRLIASVCDQTVDEMSVFGSVKKFILVFLEIKAPYYLGLFDRNVEMADLYSL